MLGTSSQKPMKNHSTTDVIRICIQKMDLNGVSFYRLASMFPKGFDDKQE